MNNIFIKITYLIWLRICYYFFFILFYIISWSYLLETWLEYHKKSTQSKRNLFIFFKIIILLKKKKKWNIFHPLFVLESPSWNATCGTSVSLSSGAMVRLEFPQLLPLKIEKELSSCASAWFLFFLKNFPGI